MRSTFLRKASVVFLFSLIGLFFSLFASQGFGKYQVGLNAGDWAEYHSSRGPFRILVSKVNGTRVEYEIEGEKLPMSWSSPIDLNSTHWFDPVEYWGRYPFFIAEGLNSGERVYNHESAPMIENITTRTAAGMLRELNYLHINASPYGGSSEYTVDAYYDRLTGFLTSVKFHTRGMQYEAEMTRTNRWTTDYSQPYMIIGGAAAVIVLIGIFSVRKHRNIHAPHLPRRVVPILAVSC